MAETKRLTLDEIREIISVHEERRLMKSYTTGKSVRATQKIKETISIMNDSTQKSMTLSSWDF